jgi:hypothetical protein
MDAGAVWFYSGAAALLVGLYAVKALVLRYTARPWTTVLFALALGAGVPAAWALDPDWNNPHVFRVAILVGTPVGLLAVPLASFLFDSARGTSERPRGRLVRAAIELLVVVPAWFFSWLVVQVFVLGWVWF